MTYIKPVLRGVTAVRAGSEQLDGVHAADALFWTGHLSLSDSARQFAAGQFNANTATGEASNADLGGNTAGSPVSVGVSVTNP